MIPSSVPASHGVRKYLHHQKIKDLLVNEDEEKNRENFQEKELQKRSSIESYSFCPTHPQLLRHILSLVRPTFQSGLGPSIVTRDSKNRVLSVV